MIERLEYTLTRPPSCPTNQDHLTTPSFRLICHWKTLRLDDDSSHQYVATERSSRLSRYA